MVKKNVNIKINTEASGADNTAKKILKIAKAQEKLKKAESASTPGSSSKSKKRGEALLAARTAKERQYLTEQWSKEDNEAAQNLGKRLGVMNNQGLRTPVGQSVGGHRQYQSRVSQADLSMKDPKPIDPNKMWENAIKDNAKTMARRDPLRTNNKIWNSQFLEKTDPFAEQRKVWEQQQTKIKHAQDAQDNLAVAEDQMKYRRKGQVTGIKRDTSDATIAHSRSMVNIASKSKNAMERFVAFDQQNQETLRKGKTLSAAAISMNLRDVRDTQHPMDDANQGKSGKLPFPEREHFISTPSTIDKREPNIQKGGRHVTKQVNELAKVNQKYSDFYNNLSDQTAKKLEQDAIDTEARLTQKADAGAPGRNRAKKAKEQLDHQQEVDRAISRSLEQTKPGTEDTKLKDKVKKKLQNIKDEILKHSKAYKKAEEDAKSYAATVENMNSKKGGKDTDKNKEVANNKETQKTLDILNKKRGVLTDLAKKTDVLAAKGVKVKTIQKQIAAEIKKINKLRDKITKRPTGRDDQKGFVNTSLTKRENELFTQPTDKEWQSALGRIKAKQKRGRGRPKGSKNKPKQSENVADTKEIDKFIAKLNKSTQIIEENTQAKIKNNQASKATDGDDGDVVANLENKIKAAQKDRSALVTLRNKTKKVMDPDDMHDKELLHKMNQEIKDADTLIAKGKTTLAQATGKSTKATGKNTKVTDQNTQSKKKNEQAATKAAKSLNKKAKEASKLNKDLKSLNAATKKVNRALGETNKTNKKVKNSAAFTGLAFGFIGGMANYARMQVEQLLFGTLREVAPLMAEVKRSLLFSDQPILSGLSALDQFDNRLQEILIHANKLGITFEDAATIYKNVEKAIQSGQDPAQMFQTVLELKALENEVDSSKIVADFATFGATFKDLTHEQLKDAVFTLSKETKLTFGATSKALAFAAGEAMQIGTSAEDFFSFMALTIPAIPGERGTSGRAGAQLVKSLTDPENLQTMEKLGIDIVDDDGNYKGLLNAAIALSDFLDETEKIHGQAAVTELLHELELPQNARRSLFSLKNTTPEERAAALETFDFDNMASLSAAAAEQAKTGEAAINRFNNLLTEMKIGFAQGFFPLLDKINEHLREVFDADVMRTLREFGDSFGASIVGWLKLVLPHLKNFLDYLNNNKGAVDNLANAMTTLLIVLQGLTTFMPLLGASFAVQFIRLKALKSEFFRAVFGINLMEKAIVKLKNTSFVTALMGKFSILSNHITNAGAIAGAKFGMAFNILSNAFIGAGTWFKALLTSISSKFAGAGVLSGISFGTAFIKISGAFMAALPFAKFIAIALAAFSAGYLIGKYIIEPIMKELDSISFESHMTGENPILIALKRWFNIDLSELFNFDFIKWRDDVKADLEKAWKHIIEFDPVKWHAETKKALQEWWDNLEIDFGKLGETLARVLIGSLAGGIIGLVAGAYSDIIFAELKKLWNGDYNAEGTHIGEGILGGVANTLNGLGEIITKALENAFLELVNWMVTNIPLIPQLLGFQRKPTGETIHYPNELGPGEEGPEGKYFSDWNDSTFSSFAEYEESLKGITEKNETAKEKIEAQNVVVEAGNVIKKEVNSATEVLTTAIGVNTTELDLNTAMVDDLTEHELTQINTIVPNVNMLSGMTVMMAEVNVMWARLAAEGNRAAGKLASLIVSKQGIFSISDPGISAIDQQRISDAQANLAASKNAQTFLEYKVDINIDNEFNVNPDGENVKDVSKEIADEVINEIENDRTKHMQKYANSILG